MANVWQFWEFEHPSGKTVRVIATPDGLEIFAEDVFQILAPELDAEEVIHLNIKIQKRCVILNCHCPEVTIQNLNSLAIHNLIGMAEAGLVKQFMQWVRSNILPIFHKDFI